MSGSLFARLCCVDGRYAADSGSKGEDWSAPVCGRGVLGSSESLPSARGDLPVYLRGEGDRKAAFPFVFFDDPILGVV